MSNQNNQRNYFVQKHLQTTALASVLLLAALTSPTVQAKTASEVYEQAAKSTVVVANFDAQGKQKSMGSGVVMPDGDVVTNCHVVKGAARLTVRVGQTERPATMRYSDWDRDVCSLSSSGLNAPAAKVGSSKTLKVGAKVYAIGAPKGLELTLSDGIVSSLRDLDDGQYIQTTAAISPGSSGGGLYDDKGALVGLTTFYFAEGQSLNFAVPIDWVKDLPILHTKTQQTEQASFLWLQRALALQTRKEWTELLAYSQRWVLEQPKNKQSWFNLGLSYAYKEQYSEAINAFQTSLRIDPESVKALNNLGAAYGKTKQYSEAVTTLQKASNYKPEHAQPSKTLGDIYIEMKEYPKAVIAYQQALRIDPEFSEAWLNLGNTYGRMQLYSNAIQALVQTLRINPENASAWANLGITYHRLGDREKMMDAYKRLRELDPARADKFFSAYILPK